MQARARWQIVVAAVSMTLAGEMKIPDCGKSGTWRIECYEAASPCQAPLGCAANLNEGYGMGRDRHAAGRPGFGAVERCGTSGPLCLFGFKDLVSGEWVYVYRDLCTVWCDR